MGPLPRRLLKWPMLILFDNGTPAPFEMPCRTTLLLKQSNADGTDLPMVN